MLITRPDHDETTRYLYYWSIVLLKQAQRRCSRVIDLSKKRACKKEFISIVTKTKPSFIVFNGHGNESMIAGYNNEPLIISGKNHAILINTIVYARSCKSAKLLGKKSVESGCKAFIGYMDDFVFVIEADKLSRPLNDKTARLFLEPANYVVMALLKGHTTGEANHRSKDLYKQTIQKLATSETTRENSEVLPFLVWDYSHQVCLGDTTSTVAVQ